MSSSAAIDVAVQVASEAGDIPDKDAIAEWVGQAVGVAGGVQAGGLEVAVRIVGETEMRALNREYRDRDSSTNVLSFPAGAIDGLPDELPCTLGDIVVCAPVVRREAAEQGKTPDAHWAHMLVHATLHLLGYDHVSAEQATEMEALEVRILSRRGVPDPYKLA